MHVVWRVVSEQAEAHGARVIGSELVGLVPIEAVRVAGRAALGGGQDAPDIALVDAAVRSLQLDALGPFDPSRRVLEWAMGDV
jgi:glutamate formiminotransferase/formiminotetrahydrofolate cyclodeaminase